MQKTKDFIMSPRQPSSVVVSFLMTKSMLTSNAGKEGGWKQ